MLLDLWQSCDNPITWPLLRTYRNSDFKEGVITMTWNDSDKEMVKEALSDGTLSLSDIQKVLRDIGYSVEDARRMTYNAMDELDADVDEANYQTDRYRSNPRGR